MTIPSPDEAHAANDGSLRVDVERLRQHVCEIAREPRPAESDRLEELRGYVTDALCEFGWQVERDPFQAESQDGKALLGTNLVATHPAVNGLGLPRLCVGAHLDSRPETPGADDNASGVAALLEIARLLPQQTAHKLQLELVAFDLEEDGMLGGAYRAELARNKQVDLRGMISLEMIGYCDHTPDSQNLPRKLVGKYPDVGNFIAVVGNQNSTELIERFSAGMKLVAELPVETLQVDENGNYLQATRLSDHSPYWDAGFPALMITDTSFLRNPHYHFPSDTPETLDFLFLERVTSACVRALERLIIAGM